MGRPASTLAVLALAVLAVASTAHAAEPAAEDPAETLLRLSGLDAQLPDMAPQILSGVRAGGKLPAPVERRLFELVHREYSPAVVRREILTRVSAGLDPVRAEAAVAWLRSPTGERVRVAEEVTSTPEVVADIEAHARELARKGPAPARLALMNRIEAASGTTDLLVDTIFSTSMAVAVAMGAVADADARADALVEDFEMQRLQLRPQLREAVLLTQFYAYRELSDPELESYAAFLESDAGRWYVKTLSRAFVGALTASARRLGTGLAQAIGASRAPRQPL